MPPPPRGTGITHHPPSPPPPATLSFSLGEIRKKKRVGRESSADSGDGMDRMNDHSISYQGDKAWGGRRAHWPRVHMSKNVMLCGNAFALRPTFFDVTLYMFQGYQHRSCGRAHQSGIRRGTRSLRTPHDHLSASESAFLLVLTAMRCSGFFSPVRTLRSAPAFIQQGNFIVLTF